MVYTVRVICRKVGDCMNEDYEPMLNENVSQETDMVSEIPISDVRELYKDDDRFNPVTVYRLVKMFEKLSLSDMMDAVGRIMPIYNKKIEELLSDCRRRDVNLSIAKKLTDDRLLQTLMR